MATWMSRRAPRRKAKRTARNNPASVTRLRAGVPPSLPPKKSDPPRRINALVGEIGSEVSGRLAARRAREFFSHSRNQRMPAGVGTQNELVDPLEFVRPKPKSPARLAGFFFFRNDVSGRVSGVERRRRLLRAVLRHFGGVGGSFLAARPETRPRVVVLGGATLLAALADPGFLTDRLRHVVFASGFALLGTSRRHIPDRRRSCTPGLSGPAAILHERQCRVPPSPPAIRRMKKPRQRMRRPGVPFVLL